MGFLKGLNTKKLWYIVVLIIVLIPTYFIHTKKYPDWGDDFAQYIYQAQQINTPSQKYKEVLNLEGYSSSKRSVFFSIVLSVVNPSLQIQNYVNVISILYIIAAICCFMFLSNYFNNLISLLGTLVIFYNFLFLRLKSEVVPEFLFIAIFLLILYITYDSKKWIKWLIPILIALLVSVRFIGLSLLLGYILAILFQKNKMRNEKITEITICLILFTITSGLINLLFLSSVQNHEINLYGNYVFTNCNSHTFIANVNIYTNYITLFFEQEIPFWLNKVITFFVLVFFIIGWVSALKNKCSIVEFAFIFYGLFLLIFPYNGDTIRYLIPIVPLFIYYSISGMQTGLNIIGFKWNIILISVCLSIVIMSNTKTIWLAMHSLDTKIEPYDISILKDFEELKKNVKPNQTVAFGKPFIINLLGDRDSYFLSNKNYDNVFTKADYVLSPKQSITELYPKIKGIKVSKGDTIELTHFYLIKL
jgi:hypothetical protein